MTSAEKSEKQKADGARYRAMRESIGLSREGLADILGRERSGIFLRESGKRKITLEHWLALEAVMMRTVTIRSDKIRSMPHWKLMAAEKQQG